ncbi:hypothetical protein H2O73_00835 [Vibrio sp. 404]|uniref:Uncharacterized protein n=1 Tax=Vibrio marinisediminis TaxID=2758441 RepID=A0A7W2IS20_9VIBR|nr:hypothetical protein [Vibrio marinisediminis]MBA5760870.1 hypothetical protein [Vibrio marinisediminis]
MKQLVILSMLLSFQCLGADLVYLTCNGVAKDTELNVEIKKVENDFLLNRDEKTIQQIITGLSEEQTNNLRQSYTESTTQYVTSNDSISINRRTLEYTIKGIMGMRIYGKCKIAKPVI